MFIQETLVPQNRSCAVQFVWSETPSPIALDLREKEDTTAYEEKIKKHQENTLALLRKDVLVNE